MLAEMDLLDLRRIRHRGDDDVARPSDLLGRRGCPNAGSLRANAFALPGVRS
jgi:hypothetical protein